MVKATDVKYTPDEFAALQRTTVRTLNRWRKDGYNGVILKPMKIGRRIFYTDALFAEFQRQCDLREERMQRGAKRQKKVRA